MINVKIRILRGLLEEAIKNIDAGNSNHTEEELSEIIDNLTKLNISIKRISKTYACEKILHCSPSTELQFLIQQELINSVKGKVANSPRGKELLDMQLKNIKDKKAKIVEEANKEAELFKKFQIATQANPNLTYAEFIKSINGK